MKKEKFDPNKLHWTWPLFKDGIRRMVHKDNLRNVKKDLAEGEYEKWSEKP